jgi:GntR family transcriptional regulator, transcriptional repressor for pyruvate dehydrogenase complex
MTSRAPARPRPPAGGPRVGTLVTKVIDELRADILATKSAGDRLPTVDELAHRFGVSRTVVREAVGVLAAKGLVDVRHGDGTYVREPGIEELAEALANLVHFRARDNRTLLIDVMELRRTMESAASRFAATRATPEDVAAIGSALARGRAAVQEKDRKAALEADIDFHAAIGRASHNSLLALVLDVITPLLRDVRALLITIPAGAQASVAGHERIFSALVKRDPELSYSEALAHTDFLNNELYNHLFGAAATTNGGSLS